MRVQNCITNDPVGRKDQQCAKCGRSLIEAANMGTILPYPLRKGEKCEHFIPIEKTRVIPHPETPNDL